MHAFTASAVIYEDSVLTSSRLAVGLGRNIYSDGVQGYQDVNFTSRNIPTYTGNQLLSPPKICIIVQKYCLS